MLSHKKGLGIETVTHTILAILDLSEYFGLLIARAQFNVLVEQERGQSPPATRTLHQF
jgi:hypothetical protein